MFSGIFQQSNDLLQKSKDDSKGQTEFHLEVEFKLKTYGTKREGSVPDVDTYNQTMNHFKKWIEGKEGWVTKLIEKDTVLLLEQDFRQVTSHGQKKETYFEKKWIPEDKAKIRSEVYPCFLQFSYEQKVNQLPENIASQNVQRDRTRQSFTFGRKGQIGRKELLSVDFTEVVTNQEGVEKITYEIEIEAKSEWEHIVELEDSEGNKKLELSEMQMMMSDVGIFLLKVMHKTDYFYTLPERNNLITRINSQFGGVKTALTSRIEDRFINKPRSLTWKDFDNDNPDGLFRGTKQMNYAVTIKTDGTRIFVFWHETGVYLFNPLNEWINKISDEPDRRLNGTMLDGELLPGWKESGIYKIEVFDCLFSTDMQKHELLVDIRDQELRIRIRYARYVQKTHIPGNSHLYINLKQHFPFTDTKSFYEANTKASKLNVVDGVEIFKTDGYIYTHMGPYLMQRTRRYCTDCRTGSKCDSCKFFNPSLNKKYKPVNLLTTDFQIDVNTSSELILTAVGSDSMRKKRIVAFTGGIIKADPTRFIKEFTDENGKKHTLKVGDIVEFSWNAINKIWVPIRKRTDRNYPNTIYVANENWKMIHDPIPYKILFGKMRGKNVLKLMRKFHSRIKSEILDTESKSIVARNKGQRPRLMDIGSGYGGDVKKWKHANYEVIAVEPSGERLDELVKRASEIGISSIVQTVQIGINNPNLRQKLKNLNIPQVDLVTSFFSITFLYDRYKNVDEMIENVNSMLKVDGKFVVIGLDGQVVNEQLGDNQEISVEGITIQRSKENKRKIVIKMQTFDESLAGGQIEWLVDFEDFIQRCNSKGFELIEDEYLTTNGILNGSELWFSEMNRKLVFRKMRYNPSKNVNPNLELLRQKAKTLFPTNENIINDEKMLELSNTNLQNTHLFNNSFFNQVMMSNDGSSFFHTLGWSLIPDFRELSNEERVKEVDYFRQKTLGDYFTYEKYAGLNKQHVLDFDDELSVFSYQSYKIKLMQYSAWIGMDMISLIEDYCDVNIYFLRKEDEKYHRFVPDNKEKVKREKNIIMTWEHPDYFCPFSRSDGRAIFSAEEIEQLWQ